MKKKPHRAVRLNPSVFFTSAFVVLLFSALTIFFPQKSATWLNQAQNFVSDTFSWYYTAFTVTCVIFVFWLALSRFGRIRLGPENEPPEFSYFTWVTMLFSAGIGIALVYFGAYEPLDHYFNQPSIPVETAKAASQAMVITFLHWGIHGWAVYALMAAVLAYYAFVENRPLALRTALYPIFGERLTNGWVGHFVDGFGILATVIAMVTNLGIGALLMRAGLVKFFNISDSMSVLIVLIIIMMVAATFIVIFGIERGIATLAKINLGLLCLLLLFVFLAGPTFHILDAIIQNIGDYLSEFIHISFNLYVYDEMNSALKTYNNTHQWRGLWTIFYWAWWVAWAPFVGLFIARISKGRTIRQLIFGVLLVPLGFTLLWLAVFGNTALYMVFFEGLRNFGIAAITEPYTALYRMLELMPFVKVTGILAIIISFILFIAPVDSGSMMISNLAVDADDPEDDAPIWMRVFWCLATTVVTIGLFISGNFEAIQTAVVLCGLPFSVVIICYMVSLIKSLSATK